MSAKPLYGAETAHFNAPRKVRKTDFVYVSFHQQLELGIECLIILSTHFPHRSHSLAPFSLFLFQCDKVMGCCIIAGVGHQ